MCKSLNRPDYKKFSTRIETVMDILDEELSEEQADSVLKAIEEDSSELIEGIRQILSAKMEFWAEIRADELKAQKSEHKYLIVDSYNPTQSELKTIRAIRQYNIYKHECWVPESQYAPGDIFIFFDNVSQVPESIRQYVDANKKRNSYRLYAMCEGKKTLGRIFFKTEFELVQPTVDALNKVSQVNQFGIVYGYEEV